MATEHLDAHPTEPNDNLGPLADDEEIGPDGKRNKRKERLEQNRISARESRKRKKTMIEELQRTVITLSRDNKDLNDRNEALRRQLMEIGTKYPNIVPLHAIMGGALGAPPTDQGLIAQYTRPAYATLQQMVPMQQQTPQQTKEETTNAV